MKKGFTLAEVLITLGIIGVVAALTLPGVMQSYQKKVYVAQLQRVYNEIANGARAYMNKQGVDALDEGGGLTNGVSSFMNNYLTVAKTGNSMADSYKSLSNENSISFSSAWKNNGSCASLDTGASICISTMTNGVSKVYVDLNGKNSPNIIGRDFFAFNLNRNGRISDANGSDSKCKSATTIDYAAFCTGAVHGNNWTMDY